MTTFQDSKYQLFFSNKFPPLVALNYADELFFNRFYNLVGMRYRILSIIRNGWQRKYGLLKDIEQLKLAFKTKIREEEWIENILNDYEDQSKIFRSLLQNISKQDYDKEANEELCKIVEVVRE